MRSIVGCSGIEPFSDDGLLTVIQSCGIFRHQFVAIGVAYASPEGFTIRNDVIPAVVLMITIFGSSAAVAILTIHIHNRPNTGGKGEVQRVTFSAHVVFSPLIDPSFDEIDFLG